MLELFSYRDVPVEIEGQAITLQIKRLTFDESEVYRRQLDWFTAIRKQPKPSTLEEASKRDDDLSAFVTQAIGDYVRVKPGQMTFDGAPVSTGLEFVRAYGGSPTVVIALLMAISAYNEVSDDEKKAWLSLSDSKASSPAPTATASGGRPGATADAAVPAGSAPTAIAPVSDETSSSGSTASSS